MLQRRTYRFTSPTPLLWMLSLATSLSLGAATLPASANCPGSLIPLEESQALIQPRWDALQQMETYPWGTARVYGQLEGDRITLTPAFDQLQDGNKLTALEMLDLGITPYRVYASDGRLLSAAYDGCTRFHMVTERQRYSWYFLAMGRSLPFDLPREELRNAGRPGWRDVRVEISPAREREIRLSFWSRMGYDQADEGMWIAWVPEHGYFEINVPVGYDVDQLSRFWSVAPREYRYLVLDSQGTIVMDATFDTEG